MDVSCKVMPINVKPFPETGVISIYNDMFSAPIYNDVFPGRNKQKQFHNNMSDSMQLKFFPVRWITSLWRVWVCM